MPHPSAISSDVDLQEVVGVGNHAVTPLEIVALDALPMRSAVYRTAGCRVKAADVERVRLAWVDGQIVHVLRLREESPPGYAGSLEVRA